MCDPVVIGLKTIMLNRKFIDFSFTLVVLLFSSQTTLSAQQYRSVVFEGAGIRGIAYAGAIKELERENILQSINQVGGTSAGAIAALTVALGYRGEEIEKIISTMKFQKFNDGEFLFIGGLSRLNQNYGWYKGRAFEIWIEKIIADKTGSADITFRELHERKFRDLYVTGTSLNNQRLIVFSYGHYPEMKVKDAVRISMSVPLYFEPVVIDTLGHVAGKRSTYDTVDIMVDGGFTGNFPIYIFDSLITVDGVTIRHGNPQTLGMRIDSPDQIACDLHQNGLAPVKIDNFRDYVQACYVYVIENLNRTTLTQTDWDRTVSISSGNIGPKIKRLTSKEKSSLINNGSVAMKKYIDQHRQ
jgi:NTE family protein